MFLLETLFNKRDGANSSPLEILVDDAVTKLNGLGDSFPGVGGKGLSQYKLMMESTRAGLSFVAQDLKGCSIPSSGDEDSFPLKEGRELEREDISEAAETMHWAYSVLNEQTPKVFYNERSRNRQTKKQGLAITLYFAAPIMSMSPHPL